MRTASGPWLTLETGNRVLDGNYVATHLEADEETVRKFDHRTLADKGYTLLEAKDGAAALELGRRTASIDLLLTDVVMPNMSGSALEENLKKFHPGYWWTRPRSRPKPLPTVEGTDPRRREGREYRRPTLPPRRPPSAAPP